MVFFIKTKDTLIYMFRRSYYRDFFIRTKETLIYMFRWSYYHGFFYQNERHAYLHVS